MARSSGLNRPENAGRGWPSAAASTSRSTPVSCSAISPGGLEPAPRVGVGGAAQQPGVGLLPDQQRLGLGQPELVRALEAGELEGEHGQEPAHGVQVGAGRRPVVLDLRRLVADRPVDRPVVVDVADAAHVDELELLFGLDDVVRLEVAVDKAPVVQVAERGQDLQRVGERVRQRDRLAPLAGVEPDLLERLAADVLHHDVARGLAVAGWRAGRSCRSGRCSGARAGPGTAPRPRRPPSRPRRRC